MLHQLNRIYLDQGDNLKQAYTGVYNFLKEYLTKGVYPFHMPGHKRSRQFLPPELLDMEVTEIPGADNLLEPRGIIKELEERIALTFGAKFSFFMTNGSTGCLLSALMAAGNKGGHVVMARNCHKSLYSALVLSGLKPVYIFPEMTDINIAGGICPKALKKTLEANPGAAAVVITSPTYEGFVSDVKEIAGIAHSMHVPLIVDEAHGANFCFGDLLPDSALLNGADIVVHSLHKQLPMLSQTAALHLGETDYFEPGFIKSCVNLIQSTSPSYMQMAQVDYALTQLLEDASIIKDYESLIAEFRVKFPREGAVRLFGEEYVGKHGIKDMDLSKFLFYADGAFSGRELDFILADDYGIQVEMSGMSHVIAMTTPGDKREGFERLHKALCKINERFAGETVITRNLTVPSLPQMGLMPREAFYAKTRQILLEDAAGQVSAEFIIPYPPGIPLVAPGEVITREILNYVKQCREKGVSVIGADEYINTVEI